MTQEEQIEIFKNGFPELDIVGAAGIGHGIEKAGEKKIQEYVAYCDSAAVDGKRKFVPASGAASRMFKDIFAHKESAIGTLAGNLEKFAFYTPEVFGTAPYDPVDAADKLLGKEGLDYGSKPKGVLLFHRYKDEIRTAMAEHLVEGQAYMRDADGKVSICFTVSPEHLDLFKEALAKVQGEYEARYGVKYDISFTFQDPATNTIAVDMDNKPFLKEDGTVLTRPAGHGALIHNLNAIEEELVSVKNIDNVAKESMLPVCAKYKKALMGKALMLRDRVFGYIGKLGDAGIGAGSPDAPVASGDLEALCAEIEDFLAKEFCVTLPETKDIRERAISLRERLDRPVRVCGMVKNEGEPGGGPFIIRDKKGRTSLQILESVQISDPEMMKASTHFNPVDLVCCLHDYKGDKFDLTRYVDPDTGFISSKSYEGRPLKALELPGLWNGSMADWLTAFMEVPVETFNPVKVVLDLLKPAHQE